MKSYHQYAEEAWPQLKARVSKRRHTYRLKKGAVMASLLIIPVFLFQLFSPAELSGTNVAQSPKPVPPPQKLALSADPPVTEIQNFVLSDSEALEKLADLGPIFVELADGTKKIILTRPNGVSCQEGGKL